MEKVEGGMKLWGAGMESIGFEPRISDVPGCGLLLTAAVSGAPKNYQIQVQTSSRAREEGSRVDHSIKRN